MANFKDITGFRSGRLTVFTLHSRGNGAWWKCVCDCGGEKIVKTTYLFDKNPTKSCGCLQKEAMTSIRTTHGMSQTYIYKAWTQILQRCTNPNNPAFHNYGGRGIELHKEWRESFVKFSEYLGDQPGAKHSIDRIDNNGNYAPGNVRWATKIEQARNRRSSRLITADGVTRTIAEWIELSGLAASTVERRLKRGWLPSEAVTSAADRHRKHRT